MERNYWCRLAVTGGKQFALSTFERAGFVHVSIDGTQPDQISLRANS